MAAPAFAAGWGLDSTLRIEKPGAGATRRLLLARLWVPEVDAHLVIRIRAEARVDRTSSGRKTAYRFTGYEGLPQTPFSAILVRDDGDCDILREKNGGMGYEASIAWRDPISLRIPFEKNLLDVPGSPAK